MRISLVQTDIVWENKEENLKQLEEKLNSLQDKTDIVILPEMFSTGFSMNSHLLAESFDGHTILTLKRWCEEYRYAIVGSFICRNEDNYYNRAFFLTPSGDEYYYDKRHLFRMGEETRYFNAGAQRCIIPYKGWNICLNVCYDLRFPVWLRNINNEYDLLIIVANWPVPRIHAWNTLLIARALENQCYVCGVNRVGTDGNGQAYSGHSVLLDAKGKCLGSFKEGETGIRTVEIELASLQSFREKFPVWKDADSFTLS